MSHESDKKLSTSDKKSPTSAAVDENFAFDSPPASTTVIGKEDGKNLISLLFTECLCAPSFDESLDFDGTNDLFTSFCSSTTRSFQFIELGGIEYISLGSITSELTPMERVIETIRKLISNNEALVLMGYVSVFDSVANYDDDQEEVSTIIHLDDDIDVPVKRDTVSIPLDIYSHNNGVDLNQSLSADLVFIIDNLKSKRFDITRQKLQEILQRQRLVLKSGEVDDEADDAACLLGITLHNIAVVTAFAGQYKESIELFRDAVEAKKTYFGDTHHLVADSLNELGILYFAHGRFDEALVVLQDAKDLRTEKFGSDHPKVAMVVNNIACIEFLSNDQGSALAMFREGKHILRCAMGQSKTMVRLDLLHMAIVYCNLGYVESRLKNYDEAQSLFEEALMVQQSVLDGTHETIMDTLANIEFTNAFHS